MEDFEEQLFDDIEIKSEERRYKVPTEFNEEFRQKERKRILRVTYPSGKVICYKNATNTFIEALMQIDPKRLGEINFEIAYCQLVSKTIIPKLKDYTKSIGNGWYVITQSNSWQKYCQLNVIKEQLNLDYKVEIGSDFETSSTIAFQKAPKKKGNLLVQFPDGEFVGRESPLQTYIDTIIKLDMNAIYRKELKMSNKKVVTSRQEYNGQICTESGLWLTIPSSTKDKIKSLKCISAILHIKLEILEI